MQILPNNIWSIKQSILCRNQIGSFSILRSAFVFVSVDARWISVESYLGSPPLRPADCYVFLRPNCRIMGRNRCGHHSLLIVFRRLIFWRYCSWWWKLNRPEPLGKKGNICGQPRICFRHPVCSEASRPPNRRSLWLIAWLAESVTCVCDKHWFFWLVCASLDFFRITNNAWLS